MIDAQQLKINARINRRLKKNSINFALTVAGAALLWKLAWSFVLPMAEANRGGTTIDGTELAFIIMVTVSAWSGLGALRNSLPGIIKGLIDKVKLRRAVKKSSAAANFPNTSQKERE